MGTTIQNLKMNIKMNAKIMQSENLIDVYQSNIERLESRLSDANASGNLISVRLIEAEIERTRKDLNEELELLTELTKEVTNG
jgi:hypothetical protein